MVCFTSPGPPVYLEAVTQPPNTALDALRARIAEFTRRGPEGARQAKSPEASRAPEAGELARQLGEAQEKYARNGISYSTEEVRERLALGFPVALARERGEGPASTKAALPESLREPTATELQRHLQEAVDRNDYVSFPEVWP